jgi:hypothetical protein
MLNLAHMRVGVRVGVGVSPRNELVEWMEFPPPAALARVDLPRKRER